MVSETAGLALANVLYEKKGSVAYVTVNRPKVLNALNTPTWSDLRKAFEDARDDAAVRGVILTGAGDKAFIAGADIRELAQVAAFEAEQSSRLGQEVLDLIENLGKPVIAAVNGFALGGGCETAMACTIRIAMESAKFGQPEVMLGLIPGGGGTQRLPRLVGNGTGSSTHTLRRDDHSSGGLSHRTGQRDRSGHPSDPTRRGNPHENRLQCSDCHQVRARGGKQGDGDKPKRRAAARGGLFRALRRDRGQEGRDNCLPRKARITFPRTVKKPRRIWQFIKDDP
jgi:hypothetical protein